MNDTVQLQPAPISVSFYEAFLLWLKLGFISFGGPASQISMMHMELVKKRRWISERRFMHALNYCLLLPGPEAQQLAIYMGWLMHRTWGGIVAGILFVLPSLIFLIALSWAYIAFSDLPIVVGLFYGIKPAVTVVGIHAVYSIGLRSLTNKVLFIIAVVAFFAIFAFNIPFPFIIITAGLIGYLGGRFYPNKFTIKKVHHDVKRAHNLALIDDDTPMPKHARFRWSRLVKITAICTILWVIPMGWLVLNYSWDHTLTQMSWFFTKAAFLTFGGAHAVLPYVYQGAVVQNGWLSSAQMIDGLGLDEITPGPLIIVVAFIGFIGGYVEGLFGPDHLFLAGAIAAVLVSWFTFLPSFMFIFAGGPLIESTKNDLKFTAPLTAITASVVGVILNLAIFFAYHVLWPHGFLGHFDWVSALIMVLAGVALFYFKRSVIQVILACAVIGLILKTLIL